MRLTDSKESKERSFLTHAAIYGFGTILMQTAGILLLPIYVYYVEPAEFGILEIINRTGEFVIIGLMANGFRMATLTFYRQAESAAQCERIAITISVALIGIQIFGLGLAVVFAPSLNQWLGLGSNALFIFGVVTVLAEAGIVIPLALMQARLESSRFVLASVLTLSMRILLTLIFLAVFGLGLWGVLIARLINAIVFGVALNFVELRKSSLLPDLTTLKKVIRFSLPFLPGGLLAFFVYNGDRFFLIKVVGETEVGFYALSYRLAGAIAMFSVTPLYKVWASKMYDVAKQENASEYFGLIFSRFMAAFVILALALILFAGDILKILGGSNYMAATITLGPLAIATFFQSSSNLMDAAFYIRHKTKYKPLIFLITGTVIFVGYMMLIPPFGNQGAAWATVIAFVVHTGVTLYVTQRIFPVNYEWVRLSVFSGSALLLYFVSWTYHVQEYRIFLDVCLVALLIAVAWGLSHSAERQFIFDFFRRRMRQLQTQHSID